MCKRLFLVMYLVNHWLGEIPDEMQSGRAHQHKFTFIEDMLQGFF
jgi:hypothetical protein